MQSESRIQRTRSLALAALAGLSLATAAQASVDELFIGHENTLIQQSGPAGENRFPLIACISTPMSMVMDGDDLLVGTPDGFLMRYVRATGQFLYDYTLGIDANGMAMHDGSLLVGGADATVRRFDPHTGQELEVMHAPFAVSSLRVVGDRIFAGTTLGLVYYAEAHVDSWEFLNVCASGEVVDMQVIGSEMLIAGSLSDWIFRIDLDTNAFVGQFMLPEQPTTMLRHGEELLVGTDLGNVLTVDLATEQVVGSFAVDFPVLSLALNEITPVGSSFCEGTACPCGNDSAAGGCANSTGVGAELVASGTPNLSVGDVSLTLRSLPPNQVGIVIMSQGMTSRPFGDGKLCAVGGGNPAFRFPVQHSGPSGVIREVDVATHAADHFAANGRILGGTTWNFQGYYRDPAGPCGSQFNTTNAYSVTFSG